MTMGASAREPNMMGYPGCTRGNRSLARSPALCMAVWARQARLVRVGFPREVRFMRISKLCFSALLVGFATMALSTDASACGGTFCDSGPNSMPVDQTGENVIFVMDDGFV